MDADLFRAGMRRLTAAVGIVSAHSGEGPAGATVSSVTSLCADPQSLLLWLNRTSAIHRVIAQAHYFAVNVLHHSQANLAASFADPRQCAQRFEQGQWELDDKRASCVPVRTQPADRFSAPIRSASGTCATCLSAPISIP